MEKEIRKSTYMYFVYTEICQKRVRFESQNALLITVKTFVWSMQNETLV